MQKYNPRGFLVLKIGFTKSLLLAYFFSENAYAKHKVGRDSFAKLNTIDACICGLVLKLKPLDG